MNVKVLRPDGMQAFWGRTADVSENGVAATVCGQLFIGDVVTLSFSPDRYSHPVEVRASVRFQRGFFCGFEFLILNPAQREQIKRMCEQLSRQSVLR